MTLRFSSAGATSIGRRSNNEDAYSADDALGFYALADGIGGSQAGEVASELAVRETLKFLQDRAALNPGSDELLAAVTYANEMVVNDSTKNSEHAGMGTTLVALLRQADDVHLLHLGDSRGYRLRSGLFERLTRDQTGWGALEEEFERRGETLPAYILSLKKSSYALQLTGHIGGWDDRFKPCRRSLSALPHDVFLLCSDGLHGVLTDEQIAQILVDNPDPQMAADALIAAALLAGGKDQDNVTVVVIRCT